VALSADALLASAAASEAVLGGPGQWLLALPQTYIAGIGVLVRSFAAETEPIVMDPTGFTAERFVEAAAQLDGALRFTSLVPAQLIRLLDDPAAHDALRRFDRVLVGGQATPPPLLARALDAGVRLTRTYGSSETAGGCVYDGVPIGSTRLRVTDGQIEISGPTLAEGYLLDPERTDAAFISDATERWFRTGDLGSIDDGVLSVSGRLDDVIVSGGVKVALGEIERLVRTILVDAVVVPAPDERWGQVPVVVATQSADLTELRRLASTQLGAAAAPARVVVVDSIPLLSSGKPDRLALRAAVGG
jgi:O-succinylbenzoic acid--CoA ligase